MYGVSLQFRLRGKNNSCNMKKVTFYGLFSLYSSLSFSLLQKGLPVHLQTSWRLNRWFLQVYSYTVLYSVHHAKSLATFKTRTQNDWSFFNFSATENKTTPKQWMTACLNKKATELGKSITGNTQLKNDQQNKNISFKCISNETFTNQVNRIYFNSNNYST